jgi:DNA-directed RNA polymerase subunit L
MPMGFVFIHCGIGQDSRQRSSISPLAYSAKFIDPDYTITFIRGDETYASYVIKNEAYSGEVSAPTAVDNAEDGYNQQYYRPHPLEDQISMNIKTKVPIKDPKR